ncbi:Inosine triphosphate pyrophosphatase-like protein [Naviculisporaceae sp. PSN 640]
MAPQRTSPNIIITGTPGVGKTTHAELVAERTGLKHISVNDIVKDKECHEGWDDEYQSWIVDEDKLLDAMEDQVLQGGCIIDWHACDLFPKSWIDLVVVLRVDSTTLYDRLTARKYPEIKLQENLDSEIMEVLLQEARDSYDEEIVVELQSNDSEEMDSNVDRIEAWVKQWKENNNTPTQARHIVNFITGNANKLREVKEILEPAIQVESQTLDLIEIQGTLEEVTLDKCRRAADLIQGPVLVEDTCLCFDALNGLPGPYIKWFLTSLGHDGLNNLLAAYPDNKGAKAVCTFGYSAGPGHEPILFQGITQGKIVPPRGPTNFGWDPIFEYEGATYAEMEKSQKNAVSHRGKALAKLREWFAKEMSA